jgi:voltage-gated potassium channel
VFQTAIIAGVMAAKKTGELIPFCHPLSLEDCKIAIHVVKEKIVIEATATVTAKTGVEMEALTGATVAALTVYDMCKALSHDIVIQEIKLLEKTGGKKDFKRLYLTLEPSERGGTIEKIFEIFLIAIIVANILAIVLETEVEFRQDYDQYFTILEVVSLIFFSLEYIARVYSIVENPKFSHPVKGRLRYLTTPLAVIDLLAVVPFYIKYSTVSLTFLRIFRIMALFRVFKIARYMHALKLFKHVLKDRKEQLVLSVIFILFVLVIISFVMFYAEHDAQPEKFSSIPATMWWGIATLTTVGYGDMVPITALGKTLGGIFAIAGVGLLALPAGILSSGFFELLHSKDSDKKSHAFCPHCGNKIND